MRRSALIQSIGILLFGWQVLLSATVVKAQDFIIDVDHFKIEDGLADRFIKDLYQDQQGFIWIATNNGLNRFDGVNFQLFNSEKNNSFHRTSHQIREDVHGNIWIEGSNDGINVQWHSIITKDLEVTSIDTWFEGRLPAPENELLRVVQTPGNILYLYFTNGRFYKYDGEFTALPIPEKYNGIITNVKVEPDGGYAYLSKDSIFYATSSGAIIAKAALPGKRLAWPNGNAYEDIYLIQEKENPWYGFYYSEPGKHSLKKIDFLKPKENPQNKHLQYSFYTYASDSLLYIGKLGSVYAYDLDGHLVYDYTSALKKLDGRIVPTVVYVDRAGKIWLGTEEGLIIIHKKKTPFKQYLSKEITVSTRGIVELPDSSLLSATYQGVFSFNTKGEKKELLGPQKINPWGVSIVDENELLFCGHANVSLLDYQGKIKAKIKQQPGEYNQLLQQTGIDLTDLRQRVIFFVPFKDVHGKVWLGTSQGLWYMDRTKKHLLPYETFNSSFLPLFKVTVNCFETVENGFLVGTSNGLFGVDTLQRKAHFYKETRGLSIHHMYQESADILWMASNGNGIVKWNKKSGEINSFTKENGLSNNNTLAVYPDEKGNLWVPSYYGLMYFNTSTYETQFFWENDGLSHNEFNRISHLKAKDGTLYFGGLNGISSFNPATIAAYRKESSPLRVIAYEELEGKTGHLLNKTKEFLKDTIIELTPEVKSAILHFALLNFENSEKNRYAYQIDGLESDWTEVKENYIRFNQLPYGSYTLRIKGKSANGVWSSEELEIPLSVLRPFYARWEWQLFGLLLLALLIYGIIRYRTYYFEQEQKYLERIVKERTAIIESQKEDLEKLNATKDKLYAVIGHDLRDPVEAFKGVVRKINFLLKKKETERVAQLADYVEESAENLSNLLENLLHWAQQQRGELLFRPSKHQFSKLTQEVFDTLKIYADSKRINLEYEDATDLAVFGDYQMLTTVLRNLVHNAIKFSRPGSGVQVCCKKEEQQTIIKITDYGIGIPDEKIEQLFSFNKPSATTGTSGEKGTGLGLVLCKELVERHGGTLTLCSEAGKGTTFYVKLPFID